MTPGRRQTLLGTGLVAAALLMQGCATAAPAVYGPIGAEAPYGYSDHENPDGSHTVLVVMAGNATVAALREFFDRRATELCPAGLERTNVFRVHADEYYASAPAVYGGAGFGTRGRLGVHLEGYVYCKSGSDAPSAAPAAGDGARR